ncbi:acyltransferase, putative [Trypanosoma brucei gambiense DAL972]|uniref:Acyltransferase, putative n=1 Tax=Trypanosoma brucei gambiense (strain MHOM/CI/86/DAL972) TaxID=679716 RepID=C9ZL05_TRYB9|nr:acyltransferase, putative [Trypanosoma brucei gambiense DAL972]CBH10013.1 acyltransferase, putative [Trypanosoma brucei gambiense DAL972]|eukprot:XP_011772304.1 acyltransferase, putative [Trypanosoma brucei gambiense DAL972]
MDAGKLFHLLAAIVFMKLLFGCIFARVPLEARANDHPPGESFQHAGSMGEVSVGVPRRSTRNSRMDTDRSVRNWGAGHGVGGALPGLFGLIPGIQELMIAFSCLTWPDILWRYFLFLLLLLTFLYFTENVRDLLYVRPRMLRLGDSYLTEKPPRVGRDVALSYDTPWCLYEVMKTTFFAVTGLLAVRLFIFVLFSFMTLVVMSMAGRRGRNRNDNPLWFSFFTLLAYITFCVASVGIGFYNFRVFGRIADRSECKILISNHSCVFEVVLLFALAQFPSFITRKETKLPLFESIVRLSDSILVDRSAAESRRRAAEAIAKRAKDRDPLVPQLLVFPEGTTTNQRTLFMFRKGAMEPGEPIQMICVGFPYKHFNPCWNGRCCGGNSFGVLILRLCSQFVNRVEVRPLPIYVPTESEREDPILYANRCQEMMANVLGCGVSECTYADYVALLNEKSASAPVPPKRFTKG